MKFAGAHGITRSRVPLIAMLALAGAIGLAGCEGDDGKDGAIGPTGPASTVPGPTGPTGPTGPAGQPVVQKPLESCAVCHDTGSVYAADDAHAIDREVSFTVVTPPAADVGNPADLVVTFNIKVNGVNFDNFTNIQRSTVFNGALEGTPPALVYRQYDLRAVDSIVSNGNGNYTIKVGGAAQYLGKDSKYYFRLESVGVTPARRASVYADDAAFVRPALVSNESCQNCHSTFAGGLTSHHYNPFNANACVACHSAVNPSGGYSLIELAHGIHNSHNMPSGEYEGFSVTYPTYTTNCSVCHDSPAALAAANAMPVTPKNCFSCHESMESWDFTTTGTVFHEAYDETTNCQTCHSAGNIAPATVTAFHNGLTTERAGVIWNGVDTSVIEGDKIDMQIMGIVDNGATLAISWTAKYDGVDVNPCNATIGASTPLFFNRTAPASNFSMLRSYFQGDDPIIGMSTTAPGQALAVNLSTTNTSCAGNVATTTIAVDASRPAGSRGIVALQGKPAVPNANPAVTTPMLVRALTPTREFVVGTGAEPTAKRRPIADTAACVKCHVGSLYQHGGNRVDNVDMCTMCHNSASSEKNVRVGWSVDASKAYDGKTGETYEFKTMLHSIHSAGGPDQRPYVLYRASQGVFAWAPDESLLQNWPGTGSQTVFGAVDASGAPVVRNHSFHAPTYPRALNDCGACHTSANFKAMVDQAKGMATTVEAGAGPAWNNQLDDTLKGANSAACTSCHQGSAAVGHANQNGWAPAVFPNGRQTIIDEAR